MDILSRFSQITTFVFDVDGVLTDGSLIIMPGSEYVRTMNVKDGFALQLAIKKGYRVIIISGATSVAVKARMNYLGIKEVFMGVKDKRTFLQEKLKPGDQEQVLFMGDDLPDLELLQQVFLPACPADAAPEILSIAQYISPFGGGKGCVRDVVEKVMKLRNDWSNEERVVSM